MPFLTTLARHRTHHDRGKLPALAIALVCLAAAPGRPSAQTAISKEYQVKAVFLFNFAQFVEWPAGAFSDSKSPLVIGILGEDPFGTYLNDIVRGERVNGRALVVQHYSSESEIKPCHILFISRSETDRLEKILAHLKGRSILTVGDLDDFSRHGGMIRFVTENNKVRLRINVDAAKAAHLTISSKLLRPATIVSSGRG